MEAALDGAGKVVGWRHCVVGDDGGAGLVAGGMRISPYYALPNQHLELRNVDHGIRIKHWRAVAHNFNLFAIEAMVDQMATDQGMDPVEFRLQRMSITPKARKVIETVVKMADWTAKRPGRPRARLCDQRAVRLIGRLRRRVLAQSQRRRDPCSQGLGGGRWRHHRAAGGS